MHIGRRTVATIAVSLVAIGAAVLDALYPPRLTADPASFAQVVLDRRGDVLRAFADPAGMWRYETHVDEVDPKYVEALIAYEDRWFWHHPGVNPAAMVRAIVQNVRAGRTLSGGSTLTMQTARLLHGHGRSVTGKVQQMLRALQLEWHLTKPEILTLYLNKAPFGGTLEGVKTASLAYLQQDPSNLTHAQAALLAVLPQAPSRLRPDRHAQMARAARDKVLNRLLEFEVWSADVVAQALIEPVIAVKPRLNLSAPLLARRLARAHPDSPVIHSTIDGRLQAELESYAASITASLPHRTSLAILVVDNATHEVRGYVGSADFLSQNRHGHVDMVQATRSPGSALKPILYALAIEKGLIHSHSLLIDAPRQVGYRPKNFGRKFAGPVSATQALQQSLNVPAVDLLETYGPGRFAARLEHAGMRLSIPGGRPNLSMILGGAGAQLENITQLYTALATDGIAMPLRFTPGAEDAPEHRRKLVSEGASWIVSQMLKAPASELPAGRDLSWKTGTSYGFRDAWAFGYDREFTVGIWTGRPDGTPSPGRFGRNAAAPVLFDVFGKLPAAGVWAKPASVTRELVCWPLGTAAAHQPASWCHRQFRAWVLDQNVPPTLADPIDPEPMPVRFWVDGVSGLQVGTQCGGEQMEQATAVIWPRRLEAWLPPVWRREQLLPTVSPACLTVDVPVRSLQLNNLERGQLIRAASNDPRLTLSASGGSGNHHWYIDGRYSYVTHPSESVNHTFRSPGLRQIVVLDELGNSARADVKVAW